MSLIKDTLPIDEDLKNLNLNRTTAFKNPIQMLVANGSKKSVVFPINKLEKPSLDSVLNTVPLFYNPITKQLILQQDLEHQLNNNKLNNSTITSFNCNKFNKTSFNNNKKCEIRLNDKNRPNLDKEIKKLNNLNKNDEFSNNCLKEEKKLLETQLDDFTTKSINLSQRPVELNNKDKIVNNCKILNNNHHHQSLLNKLSDKTLDNKSLNKLNNKIEFNDKCENQLKEEQTTINQIKKDTYKTHRRTPSYIHDFHNLIKNNNSTNHHQIKSSTSVNKITVNSATAAIQNLTKTSLANLTSTLSSTINSTAKLNDHQMNSPIITNSNLDPKTTSSPSSQQFTNKQIVFNESKNEFYDQDTDSDGSVFLNNSHNNCNLKNNKYSIDDDNIEPLNLPSPFGIDKPKKLSFLTEPIQSVLNKLTKTSSSSNSSTNCINNQTAKPQNTATNFFQSFNLNSNERRNSKNLEVSTTGLILENRPVGLEPKNKDEELQHREQYEQMLKDVKRKDEKQTKKNLIKKKKDEERMLNAIKIWKYEIIPNFNQVKHTKKVKELWMQGLPSNLRGQIWSLAIGNRLNLTENSLNEYLSKWYDAKLDDMKLDQQLKLDDDLKTLKENDERIANCLSKCSDENIYELIKLDVSRTYPNLKLFQKDAPFHNLLLKVLGSYVIAYKPNVGYIQGMSFLLGMFLLNMKPESAFIAFANLLETSPLLMSFMNVDQIKMENFYKSFDVYFNLYLPELYQHFKQQKLNTELFMINWVNTLFTKTLPLDISTRIWDLLFKDGEQIIVKTSLTLLKLYEKELLQLDFISSAQFLTQLNANNFTIDNNKFFNELNNFNLKPVTINKKIKCKNFYSVYEHFCNNSTNINSFS